MKLTREVDIYQCPVSTKYCFLSFRRLEPNTVQMADYVRVWHGEIELDDAPEGLVEMDIQKAICQWFIKFSCLSKNKTLFLFYIFATFCSSEDKISLISKGSNPSFTSSL